MTHYRVDANVRRDYESERERGVRETFVPFYKLSITKTLYHDDIETDVFVCWEYLLTRRIGNPEEVRDQIKGQHPRIEFSQYSATKAKNDTDLPIVFTDEFVKMMKWLLASAENTDR